MSDPITPFPTITLDETPPWQWPLPPGGRRHLPAPDVATAQPCNVETQTNTELQGEMVGFDPVTRRVHVRAGGQEVSLAFARIRRLTLTVPLRSAPRAAAAQRKRVPLAA